MENVIYHFLHGKCRLPSYDQKHLNKVRVLEFVNTNTGAFLFLMPYDKL